MDSAILYKARLLAHHKGLTIRDAINDAIAGGEIPPGVEHRRARPVAREAKNTYITCAMLGSDSMLLAEKLADVDAIVGVARSGLIPAAIVATILHRPLYSIGKPDLEVLDVGHGYRGGQAAAANWRSDESGYRLVALVDDSAFRGGTMSLAGPKVAERFPQAKIVRAVVYSTAGGLNVSDVAAVYLPGAHYFEWNLFNNSGHIEHCASDLDGILCDEKTGLPIQVPRCEPLRAIVTGRPESSRGETEAWLARYGIRYQRLFMGPWDRIPDERTVGKWKADRYRECGAWLFFESSPVQARVIRETAGPVLCPAIGGVI